MPLAHCQGVTNNKIVSLVYSLHLFCLKNAALSKGLQTRVQTMVEACVLSIIKYLVYYYNMFLTDDEVTTDFPFIQYLG